MKNLLMILLVVAVAGAMPLAASAQQQLFDFNGQVMLPEQGVGSSLSLFSEIFDATPAPTPIPLDFANYQFTLVVDGLQLDVDGQTQQYSNGQIAIFQDNATAADFSNLATFTDGTAILSGVVTTLTRTKFTPTLGSLVGLVTWTGGTHLDDMAPWKQSDWGFFSGINSRADQVLPGFDERWDGKVEPNEPIVADESMSWGAVKALFK